MLTALFWACSDDPTGVTETGPDAAALIAETPLGLGVLHRETPQSPCTAAPGSWQVEGANGLALDESAVAEDLDNCLIEQTLASPKGYEAKSFLGYDPRPQQWFQTFLDSEGHWLLLSGGLVGDRMVLTGKGPGPGSSGQEVDVRVTTWADGPDRIIQTWETSKDGGSSYKTEIELVYAR